MYRRAGWSFAAAVGTTAGVFGLAHVTGLVGRLSAIQVLGEVGMVAVGGAFFAWLLIRWRDNLWVPIGLHGFMNLWCYGFACDEQPGDLSTNTGRLFDGLDGGVEAHVGMRMQDASAWDPAPDQTKISSPCHLARLATAGERESSSRSVPSQRLTLSGMASFVAGLCEELDYTRITYGITVEIVIVQERMTELLAA